MISQAEAYERGVRDAAKICDGPVEWIGSSLGVMIRLRDKVLALLQANPYRAVVETEAKE